MVPTQSRYSLAQPAGDTSWPRPRIILSAGPLIGLPPTSGLIAATRSLIDASADRIPFIARIGPIDTNGLDGARITALDDLMACRACGRGRARPAPRNSIFSTCPRARLRTKYS